MAGTSEKDADTGRKGEKFYDASFSIEAMQHEPCEPGFTWRAVLGALFIAFVMLPGVIFMGLMIGEDLGTAADWVVIILFVELARRSFMTLKKQELYILRYTVSHLSHIAGGVALGGGVFAWFVFHRYLRNSEDFRNFGIAHQVPDWFSPFGDAAFSSGFLSSVWWPALTVTLLSMVLSKLTQLSLGFVAYKVAVDVEKLPFPLAPIQAEGAIALAESSQDKHKKGYRQYCFSIGVMAGAAFGLFYVAIPTLSQAFLGQPIQLLPIPFLDLTKDFENFIPGGTFGICLNIGLLFTGFVLPWRIVVGMFTTTMIFQLIANPIFQRLGWLPHWAPGKDAIQTNVANTLDIYLSVGIGTALAIFIVGVWGMVRAILRHRKDKAAGVSEIDLGALWRRNRDRGEPPVWGALALWVVSSLGFVFLSDYLINHGIPKEEQFPRWVLVTFAFIWTPINTYINARMIGIAGQHAGVPFLTEAAIFTSGYKHVNIWFAPMPIHNYGGMAQLLRVCELTRTRFTSILKAELLVFPLMLLASFIFWTYVTSLGPIPSDSYPFVQKFWPMHAQMKALWASAMQEGQSLLIESVKVKVIVTALLGTLAMFVGFHSAGISSQYIYGGLGAMNGFPHYAVMIFLGACIGRFVLAKKFGREKWQNFAPILAVGFGAGMGLIGMFAIALNFLWVSIGTRY
jgi:hypothetical protein